MCFINTKTNGCLGRKKDVAYIFVQGGVGVGQIVSSCALGETGKARVITLPSPAFCLLCITQDIAQIAAGIH